jgi:hypothetical protein
VNTPDGRLAIFDVTDDGLELVAGVPVGMEPVAVAARSRDEAWVVNHLSDSVSIVQVESSDPRLSRVVRTLHTCDEPRDHRFRRAGRHARLRLRGAPRAELSGAAAAHDRGDGARRGSGVRRDQSRRRGRRHADRERRPVRRHAARAARSADGSAVYAAVFHSGNQSTTVTETAVVASGGLPPPPAGALGGGPPTGLIVKRNALNGHFEDEIGRDWSRSCRSACPTSTCSDRCRCDASRSRSIRSPASAPFSSTWP